MKSEMPGREKEAKKEGEALLSQASSKVNQAVIFPIAVHTTIQTDKPAVC